MRCSLRRFVVSWLAIALALSGCMSTSATEPEPVGDEAPAATEDPEPIPEPQPEPDLVPDPEPEPEPTPEDDASPASPRPDWLGTRVLPKRPDGLGEIRDTPAELRDRRLPPPDDQLPADSDEFEATVQPVPESVAVRSTWHAGCPVGLDDLRYLTVTFWGFDERPYVGELLVNASAADDLVEVFRTLYEERFPIEQMQIVSDRDLDAPPTGDGNNSTSFVCRSTVLGSNWSQHAYGLAVDINPFHNPYVRGDAVVPELASAYIDRDEHRPGMIQPGDPVTRAFDAIGWPWGGDWRNSKDWMHFSATGR